MKNPDQFFPLGQAPFGLNKKIGILLTNLGTPDGTNFYSIWKYLREFLSDKRVIELPRLLWLPLLYGIILPFRSHGSAKNYKKIWNTEKDESPLRTYTQAQEEKLTKIFADHPQIKVRYAMRYGNPSIKKVTKEMVEEGCNHIVFISLYPQYCAATTATAHDAFFQALMKIRAMPTIRIMPPWYSDPTYINALALSIEKHLKTLDFIPEALLCSFHGIPLSYSKKGDPYAYQCQETARCLQERLNWKINNFFISFQSRFGREEWLQPYTNSTLKKLALEGVKSLAIITPGFSSDCLETLEEINEEGRDIFLEAGGKNFTYIPCLNDSQEGMHLIETLVRRELQGWL